MSYRIAIDTQALAGGRSGLYVFTQNFVEALKSKRHPDLEYTFYQPAVTGDGDLSTLDRLFWENFKLPKLIKNGKEDLLHVPAFSAPFLKPKRMVVTVHDIIGKLFPNQMGGASTFYWGKWLPFTVKKADLIIADSEHTKLDLMEHVGVSEDKIRIVYPSGHEAFTQEINESTQLDVQRKLGIRGPYFLFVGTIEPRKNLSRVLEAFASFVKESSQYAEHQLVVVGSKAFAHGKFLESLLKNAKINQNSVLFTDYISHEELNALYCGARGLLFPSLYEGFGMPILEAMASGCPVVTSRQTSTPEVAGDAAILVDAYKSEQIKDALKTLTDNEGVRTDLIHKGFERIQHFSWDKTAEQTIQVYKELL